MVSCLCFQMEDLAERQRLMQGIRIFQNCSSEEIAQLTHMLQCKTVPRGQVKKDAFCIRFQTPMILSYDEIA